MSLPSTAGVTTPLGRKREIYNICQEYDVTIIEDDAYYYLQYPELQGKIAGARHTGKRMTPKCAPWRFTLKADGLDLGCTGWHTCVKLA